MVAGGCRLTAGQICDCEGEREGEAVGGGGRAVAGLGPSPSERAGIGGRRPLLFPQVGFLWGGPCGVDTGLKSIPAQEDFCFFVTLQPMKFKKVDLFPHQKSISQSNQRGKNNQMGKRYELHIQNSPTRERFSFSTEVHSSFKPYHTARAKYYSTRGTK